MGSMEGPRFQEPAGSRPTVRLSICRGQYPSIHPAEGPGLGSRAKEGSSCPWGERAGHGRPTLVYWLLIISILLVTDVSVCEEKGFLLLILTLLLLCFNRLVRYWARSLLLVFGIMLVNLLSFNAFSIDGCF